MYTLPLEILENIYRQAAIDTKVCMSKVLQGLRPKKINKFTNDMYLRLQSVNKTRSNRICFSKIALQLSNHRRLHTSQ